MGIQEIIREARNKTGMSLRAMAEIFEVSYQTIAHWEDGKYHPRYAEMYYLWTHSNNPILRSMASDVMRALNTDKWVKDTGNHASQSQVS